MFKRNRITSDDIREKFLNKYVDSLKNFNTVFPKTILDANFDKKHYTKWRNMHKPESLRRFILNKIRDTTVLDSIKEYLENQSRNKFVDDLLPFSDYTFLDLLKIRIEEIKNNE